MSESAERFHTRQRLKERYGLDITSRDLFQWAKQLAHGHGELVSRQSRHVAQWRLVHQGVVLRLVFDSQRRSILTALPPHDSPEHLAARQARRA